MENANDVRFGYIIIVQLSHDVWVTLQYFCDIYFKKVYQSRPEIEYKSSTHFYIRNKTGENEVFKNINSR